MSDAEADCPLGLICVCCLQAKYVQMLQDMNKQDKDMLALQVRLDEEIRKSATGERACRSLPGARSGTEAVWQLVIDLQQCWALLLCKQHPTSVRGPFAGSNKAAVALWSDIPHHDSQPGSHDPHIIVVYYPTMSVPAPLQANMTLQPTLLTVLSAGTLLLLLLRRPGQGGAGGAEGGPPAAAVPCAAG